MAAQVIYTSRNNQPSKFDQVLSSLALAQSAMAPMLQADQQKKAQEAARLEKIDDFNRQLKLQSILHGQQGVKTAPFNPATANRPASWGAIPVAQSNGQIAPEEMAANYQPIDEGSMIDPQQFQAGEVAKQLKAQKLVDDALRNKLKIENEAALDKPDVYKQDDTVATARDVMSGKVNIPKKGIEQVKLEFKDIGDAVIGLDPTTGKEVSRTEKKAGMETRVTPQGLYVYDPKDPSNGKIAPGTAPIEKPAKQEPDLKPILQEKANNALSVIKDLKPMIGRSTVGTMGNVGRAIPLLANEAKQVQAKINSLKSQVSMSELLKMKQSGATFGALSDTELGLLGNAVDSLDLELQDPASLNNTLTKIEEYMTKMAGGSSGTIPTVSNEDEYNKIPSGSSYILDGVEYKKK